MRGRLLLALAVALLLPGCGDGGRSESADADLVLVDFDFEPRQLTAAASEDAAFEVRNDGDVEHNVTIDEFDVDVDIAPGAADSVTFTPDQAGDFVFFCAFHPEQMVGQLTVE